MDDAEFEKHVAALVTKRQEKPKKISGQNAKYWSEIISNLYNFDRGKKISGQNAKYWSEIISNLYNFDRGKKISG